MSGCNELLEVAVTLVGPPSWENSGMTPVSPSPRNPPTRGVPALESRRSWMPPTGSPREPARGGVENPVPTFGGVVNHAEQQPNPNPDGAASPIEGSRLNRKDFLSSAAGSFLGRTLSNLTMAVIRHFWPWLMG